jgi:D-alanyl-D-alanine carboxypeptidase
MELQSVPSPCPRKGADGVCSRDWAKEGGKVDRQRLMPETQATRLETQQGDGGPEFIRYGQGILQLGKFCGHNGTIFGFSSEMFYLPEEDAVILVSVNRLDVDDESKSTDLFLAVSKTFFPEYVDW